MHPGNLLSSPHHATKTYTEQIVPYSFSFVNCPAAAGRRRAAGGVAQTSDRPPHRADLAEEDERAAHEMLEKGLSPGDYWGDFKYRFDQGCQAALDRIE